MKKVSSFLVILLLIIIICFLGFYSRSLDYNLARSKIDLNNTLDVEKMDNQIIVFHKYPFSNDEYGLGISVFKKDNWGWSTKKDTAGKMDSAITMDFLHINDEKYVVYGYINDIQIDKIKIEYDNLSEFAKIIDTDWKNIWMQKLKNKDFHIELYDINNDLIESIPSKVD
jgi:hypothetical protein